MIKINRENKIWQTAKIVISIILVIMCALTIGAAAVSSSYDVTVIDGKRSVKITTRSDDVNVILQQANIVTDGNDIINTEKLVPGKDSTVVVTRGYDVILSFNGKEKAFVGYKNVEEILDKANIKLGKGYEINCNLTDTLYNGMKIVVTKNIKVKIIADGKQSIEKVMTSTVEKILAQVGIKLGKDDIVSPKRGTVIMAKTVITVKRVKFSQRTATEKIPYTSTYENSSKLEEGTFSVKSAGSDGQRTVKYLDKYVDGKRVSSKELSSKVIKKAVNEVVLRGTKTVPGKKTVAANANISSIKTVSNFKLPSNYSVNSNLVPTSYKRKLTGSGTAYYGGYRTSTGKVPQPGYVAVNPKIIPYGSKLWIVSDDGKYVYGYAIAADTGGFIYNGTGTIADLYFNTYGECVNFGRRNITVYVL